jgi:uncharacterized protein YgiM (DUF1202 family)
MISKITSVRWRVQLPLALMVVLGILLSGNANLPAVSAAPAALRSCDPCPVVTTDRVNMRTGPGKSYPVITVIPANAEIAAFNGVTNGYRKVIYGDISGWAHRDYLRSPDEPQWIGVAATTSRLNFRSSPGSGSSVKAVMPANSIVKITDKVVDGYRFIAYNGNTGWAYDEYLVQGSQAVATRKLAIRAAPSSTAAYRGAVPAWETVTTFIASDNGYVLIMSNGNIGWVKGQYLGKP